MLNALPDMTHNVEPKGLDRRGVMIGAGLGILGGAAALSAATASPAHAAATGGATFWPYGPTRIVDSRSGTGTSAGKIAKGQTRTISLGSVFATGYPLTAILNLTVTGTEGEGFLTLWENGLSRPGSSNINWWGRNQTYGNMALVGLRSTDVTFQVYCGGTGAKTHLIIDLLGYYWKEGTTANQLRKSAVERR